MGTRGSAGRIRRGVGVLGEVLLTLGVLLALFLLWQVWWTDVEAAARQEAVVSDLEETFAAPVPALDDPLAGAVATQAPAASAAFALLRVPRWGEGYVAAIAEGVSRANVLDTGSIGHYPGTAMPGGVGNFALAGHRVSHGRPFHGVDRLRPGDPLVVETADSWFVYRVTTSRVVAPGAVSVIAPVPGRPQETPAEATITLTTCHPLFSTRERFVVHGVLDAQGARADGIPSLAERRVVADVGGG